MPIDNPIEPPQFFMARYIPPAQSGHLVASDSSVLRDELRSGCMRTELSAKTWARRMRRMELLRVKIEGDGLG